VAAGCDIEAQSQLARLSQVAAAWPRVLIAQLFACALIVASALNHNTFGLFSGAGLLALSTLPTSIVALLALRSRAGGILSPHGRYRLLSILAAILGLSNCFAIIELAQYDNGFSASLLAAGMAVASLVTYTALLPMRVTMLAFVTSFGGAILFEMSDLVVTLVGGALLICVWFSGIALVRDDIDRVAGRRDNDVRSRRATRLLEEFESRGDGWFWETNENGEISYLSQKFIELLKRPKADLLGKPLADIMIARGDTQDGERTLNFHMTTRTPFADITVRTTVLGKELHWTISGRPIMDESGRFRGYAGGGADLTEKLRSEREVKRLARFDELTGLNNRQQMRETLAEVLGESGRPAQKVALFLLDLDRFKSVNDTMGHPIGDALLKKASERLMSTVGGMGHVGRLGGDEFEVVLPGEIHKDRLDELAQSIIYQLSQPYMIDGTAITIGCSIGIARAPEAATNSEDLVRNADIALYAAKEDAMLT
jgi:diguanylate cyclase (GGDEF)-like protein/PAS domain S-box-containing protein